MQNALKSAPERDLFDRISDWLDRRLGSSGGELSRMSDAEVARAAHDIGLSRADLETLSSQPRDQALLLNQRLELLGLDAKRLADAGFLRDLQRTCAMCESKGVCEHDMHARPQSSDWTDYCPNSGVLTDPATERSCSEHFQATPAQP